MKKFSKIIALLLVVLMLATMSVSCKKTPDDEEAYIDTDNDTQSGDKDTQSDDKDSQSDDKDSQGDDKTPQSDDKVTEHGEGGGAYTETEDGEIKDTGGHEIDEDYVIKDIVTNDNGFIPEDEQGLAESERIATEASKYNFDENPLINVDRKPNQGVLPEFNLDDTGFVRAGTKLKDLKGKTLQFFTADSYPAWSYRNKKGETVDEWTWFKQLKSEIGLNIKYNVKQHQASVNAALQYMNAGKPCDLVYTNHSILTPYALCISKSITSLVNINNLGSSPGVCKTTMDLTKWGNTLRLIAPIGVVDVLWYNQTLTSELGLSDPHVMWEKGVWDWDAFKKFQLSIPKTTKDGRSLVGWTCFATNIHYTWDSTNGKSTIEIVSDAAKPSIKNNFSDPQVIAAWEFIATTNQQVNWQFKSDYDGGRYAPTYLGLYQGTTVMTATMYTQVYQDTEYSKHVQINWVPFPKANTETGKETCQSYGFGMVLPRKSVKEKENQNAALKFMELWATRFTETYFDNLNTFEYYNFNYKQRKQYFDFVTKNVVYSPAFGGVSEYGNMVLALQGNPAYNVKTEAEKHANIQANKVAEMMKYGN